MALRFWANVDLVSPPVQSVPQMRGALVRHSLTEHYNADRNKWQDTSDEPLNTTICERACPIWIPPYWARGGG